MGKVDLGKNDVTLNLIISDKTLMQPAQFWKNFMLGDEISISGTFIYNGMRRFHEMSNFDNTDELFETLYNLSVGLERLLKICVVLYEHHDTIDQEELEKSLITHNHLDLLLRIKKHVKVNFDSPHNDLLKLLGRFYKSFRYDRFSISSVYNSQKEMESLCDFLSKHLKIEIQRNAPLMGTQNKDVYRKFIRGIILKISINLYEIIKDRARNIGLYTYELRHGSKAETVFLRKIDISHEDILWKELLIYFMNTKSTSGYLEFLRGIDPLGFDSELVSDYLDCFQNDAAKSLVMDELEHYYEELEDKRERFKLMGIIAAPGVYFNSPEDE